MKNLMKNIVCMAFLGVAFFGLSAKADIYQQDFDSWTGAPQSSFTSSTDSSGWSASAAKVYVGGRGLGSYSSPWFAAMQTDGAYVKSPALTNGIGSISFRYGVDGSVSYNFEVQISGDGSSWTTLDTIDTTGLVKSTWYEYTKALNHYSNLYFRVECKTTNTARMMGIDSINITQPLADVVITDTTVIPDNIYDGDDVIVVTAVEQFGSVQSFAVTAYWKKIGGTWSSPINMTNTTGNAYVASSAIPAQLAGTKVEYYVKATFTGDNSPKYSPTGGASSPYSYTVQAQAFISMFDSMDVSFSKFDGTFPQAVEMFLDGNDFRQGVSVFTIPYFGGSKFTFEATTTNSISESYGAAITNDFPVNGDLVLDGTQIITTSNLFNQVLFRVDETDMSFSAQDCKYMDFTGWPTTVGYTDSTYDYPAGITWKAYNTSITTDNERKFRGKAAYLNSEGATSYISSPQLYEGLGELTFWYRNFTNSGVSASFDIQVSETGGTLDTAWVTVTNVTDVYSTEYLRFTVLLNDRASSFIRIKSTGGENLCVDDIVIGYAPAGIVLDNIVPIPANPTVLDSVDMFADITALQGAHSIVAKLYYRFGTNGSYNQTGMINRGSNTYDSEPSLPVGCNGILQYYFEVQFEGSRGLETTYYPSGAGEIPYELFYRNISFSQNFNLWPGVPQGNFANTSDTTGWSVENTKVAYGNGRITTEGTNYCAAINYLGSVQSPMFTNGIGVLNFNYGCDGDATYMINIQTSPYGISWTTIDTVEYPGDNRQWFSYSQAFNITNSVYLRMKMFSPTTDRLFMIDDIFVSLPASMVSISTQTRTPSYAAYNEPVDINCVLYSANPSLPANNISGRIFYRKKGSGSGFTNYVDMIDDGYAGFLGTVPAGFVDVGDTIEYYIQSSFKGYAYNDTLNFSPTYSPEGIVTQGSSYYAPPTSFFEYDARRFISDVGTMTVDVTNSISSSVTSLDMLLYDNHIWQGVISMGNYEEVFLYINAFNIAQNTADIPQDISYGETNQFESNPPLVAITTQDGSSIRLSGVTNTQYVLRMNMLTDEYIVLRCDAQNFDNWFLSSEFYAVGQNTQGSTEKWTTNMDDWDFSTDEVMYMDFRGLDWSSPPITSPQDPLVYPDEDYSWGYDYWVQYSYQIWNSKIYQDIVVSGQTGTIYNEKAQMQPGKQQAFMFPTSSNLIHDHGVGTVSLKYKVIDEIPYPITGNVTNSSFVVDKSNYRIDSSVHGFGENDDADNYHAIRLRQVDDGNYVECRVVQNGSSYMHFEVWLCQLGALNKLATYSSEILGDLETGGNFIASVKDLPTTDIIQVSMTYKGKTRTRDITAANLYGLEGNFSFASSGANMIVSQFQITSVDIVGGVYTIWYAEDFSTVISIMETNDNWTHVINGGDGQLERMGVGSLADTRSSGLGVYLDPGDSTTGVPDNELDWIEYGYDGGVSNLYYKDMVVNVHTADHAFAIIKRSAAGANESLSIKFDEVEITGWVGKIFTANNWRNSYSWVKYVDGRKCVELRESRRPVDGRQYLASPEYTSLGTFGFRYFIPSGSSTPSAKIWKTDNVNDPNTWILVSSDLITASTARDEWLSFSMSVNDPENGYLIIENASSLGSDAIICLDTVTIYPATSGGDSAWSAYNVLITDEDIFDGFQSGFLNLNVNLETLDAQNYTEYDPHVMTPRIENGIGEISFWYAMLPNAAATLSYARLRIETSDTGDDEDWDLLQQINVSSQKYQFYKTNLYDTAGQFVRFVNDISSGGVPQRLAIDDLIVIDPYATTIDITNVRTIPEQPIFSDSVKILADTTNYKFGPYDVAPTAYYTYGTGSWGVWSTNSTGVYALEMELISVNTNVYPVVYTYQTVGSIPANPADQCIQYYITAAYKGDVFAEKISPAVFRQALTNPTYYAPVNYYEQYGSAQANNPYYIVFSCAPGAVWFNEVNVIDGGWDYEYDEADETGTNSYVEITGKAGTDISNWVIEIYDDYADLVGRYPVANGTSFGDSVNGYGFWVLGAPEMSNKNMAFTNNFDEYYAGPNYLPTYYGGGILLRRSMGAVEYKICYNDSGLDPDFQDIGDDWGLDEYDNLIYKSLQLTGDGSNYVDFTWSWQEGLTPGAVNPFQIINGGGSNEFTITVTDYWFDGTNVYIVSEGTGDWNTPEVWYSTNLVVDTPEWSQLSGVVSEVSGSVVTQQFSILVSPESPTTYYRIKGQEN